MLYKNATMYTEKYRAAIDMTRTIDMFRISDAFEVAFNRYTVGK